MFSFLTASEFTIAACAATSIVTLVFSQKIKDWVNGVPAELRAGLTSVETKLKADVKAYQTALVAKVTAAPAAPAAPVAPAPAKAA